MRIIYRIDNKGRFNFISNSILVAEFIDDYKSDRRFLKGNWLHREGGPAWIRKEGNAYHIEWCIEGFRHNSRGVALEYDYGDGSEKAYYLLGKQYNERDFAEKLLSFESGFIVIQGNSYKL